MIKLQVIGHLGRDCATREVNGKNVMNFTVAHSEKYKDNAGNMVEKTVWVDCSYWSDRTAVAQYLVKGQLVYVEGTPEAEAYMNKENVAAASLRLRVYTVQLLGGRSDSGNGSNTGDVSHAGNTPAPVAKTSSAPVGVAGMDDDLPF